MPVTYNKKNLDVNVDTELDYRPLVLRNIKKQAIFKVQAGILQAFADSMRRQGFTEFRSPVLIGAPSESGADVFQVDYFEGKAFLAQSPQFNKQMMVGAFERAFTIATVFRAEKHNTTRHLMEITQMDGELGFINDYDDALQVAEQNVRDIFAHLDKNYKTELDMWEVTLPKLPKGRFPKIKVRDALKLIEKRIGKSAKRHDLDVDPEDEREICKWALEEHGTDLVWLLNFKKNKNFYTWNNPEDPEESLSYDLLCRGVEWLSGTHRIHEYEALLERMKGMGFDLRYYDHYLQAFKYGMPAEAGFSFGLERLTKQIFNLPNIREATLFPTDLKRIAGATRIPELVKGGKEMYEMILKVLKTRAIPYETAEHEPVRTSEEAAKVRGEELSNGAKALILRGEKTGNNLMVVIPGDKKLNLKAVEKQFGEGVEFEKPEVILEKFGIEVGGVPPFGHLLGMRVYLDNHFTKIKKVAFNAGLRSHSITMPAESLVEVLDAEMGKWTA